MAHTWRGRRIYWTDDYPAVSWPSNPLAQTYSLVRIHRIIAAEMLGHKLRRSEHVHHKDRNRANYRRDNLVVVGRKTHLRGHAAANRVHVRCGHCRRRMTVAHSRTRYETTYCGNRCRIIGERKASWPSDKRLGVLVWRYPIAKMLGVSGYAVKKYCKHREISTPPRGYWSRARGRRALKDRLMRPACLRGCAR